MVQQVQGGQILCQISTAAKLAPAANIKSGRCLLLSVSHAFFRSDSPWRIEASKMPVVVCLSFTAFSIPGQRRNLLLQVHEDFLKRRFVARWCSIACFVNFAIVAGAFILPLYIAWASQCASARCVRTHSEACSSYVIVMVMSSLLYPCVLQRSGLSSTCDGSSPPSCLRTNSLSQSKA